MKISTICFLLKDGQVLLSNKKRGFGAGNLNGYGGKIADGEDIVKGALREVHEEAGVEGRPEDIERVAMVNFFEETRHIFECHIFFIRRWMGEIKESEEMAYPVAYDLEEIPYEKMWQGDRVWLRLIFGGKKIEADVYYKKGMKEFDRFEYKEMKEM